MWLDQIEPPAASVVERRERRVPIGLYRLPHAPDTMPAYATPGSAAMDIAAALDEPVCLQPMQRKLIPSGLILAIPDGYEVQIRPRSGLAIKHGLTLINAVGTIDADYRDEVMIPVINLGETAYTIQPGERVAQMLVAPVWVVEWDVLNKPPVRQQRLGGFGSTGY